jgi:hypothetical protein
MRFKDGGHGVFRAKESQTSRAMEEFFANTLKKKSKTSRSKAEIPKACK